jgi:hypothetical protein
LSNDKQSKSDEITHDHANGVQKQPQRPKPIKNNRKAKRSFVQNHLETIAAGMDDDGLDAMEQDLEDIWSADGA